MFYMCRISILLQSLLIILWARYGVALSAYPPSVLILSCRTGSIPFEEGCQRKPLPVCSFCPHAAPEPLHRSLLLRGFYVFPADLAYSICPLSVSQIYIYMNYCSREINKCSSQSAFWRTFALLMPSPSLLCPLLPSRAMWQVG